MAIPGWQKAESPFHPGEQAIQERLGGREKMETLGRRMIREFLPEQHRQFYAQLSYILVGTVDAAGNPWASILVGEPGFISTPSDGPQGPVSDHRTLHIAAHPLYGDPLADTLQVGTDIGFLGIELHTRRRNRVNGVVSAITPEGFEVQVRQAFGNCPKYIQARQFDLRSFDPTEAKPIQTLMTLGDTERAAIASADTFFIATAYLDDIHLPIPSSSPPPTWMTQPVPLEGSMCPIGAASQVLCASMATPSPCLTLLATATSTPSVILR